MKHSIKFGLMGGMILFCLSMCLTSCEDILGHWEKPTPATAGGGSTATVASLTITDELLRLEKATPQAIAFTVDPVDATITWTSDNEAVATVDATGKITMLKAGKATITAKAGDKTATSTVYVYDEIVDISAGNPNVTANESWLINGDGTVVDNHITINDGATVTLNGINISRGIFCNGTANIILADGSTNIVDASAQSGEAGIKVGDAPKAFTIDAETAGTGKLTVTGGGTYNGGAGIGTRIASGANCGAITILGGIITATGGGDAAGIGTASAVSGDQQCNDISILGGTVTATGGNAAAGIGTGLASSSTNECGTITINGGTVTATGGSAAAGIGTGVAEGKTNTCGDITINGGTVTAEGSGDAAGIGTGRAYMTTNECGAIKIGTGVTSVKATKGTNSPNSIGKGYDGDGTQTCGTITIGGDDTTYAAGVTTSPFTYPEP